MQTHYIENSYILKCEVFREHGCNSLKLGIILDLTWYSLLKDYVPFITNLPESVPVSLPRPVKKKSPCVDRMWKVGERNTFLPTLKGQVVDDWGYFRKCEKEKQVFDRSGLVLRSSFGVLKGLVTEVFDLPQLREFSDESPPGGLTAQFNLVTLHPNNAVMWIGPIISPRYIFLYFFPVVLIKTDQIQLFFHTCL